MLDDLRWEYKALGLIVLIGLSITAYSYLSMGGGERVSLSNNSVEQQPEPAPLPFPEYNSTGSEENNTGNITAEEAREIAAESGYTAGDPTMGSININGTQILVWVVPLQRGGKTVREVYVRLEDGEILGSRDFS